MPYILFLFLVVYLGAIPGIIVGGIYEKKGVPSKAISTFSAPDGSRRQMQVDVTWSWTVFVFRGWSLAFRGQFMDFLIMMLVSSLVLGTGALGIAMTAIFNPDGFITWTDANSWGTGTVPDFYNQTGTVVDHFTHLDTWQVVWWVFAIIAYLAMTNYYVAFANKRRLQQFQARGMDLSQTPNLDALYKYLDYIPRTNPQDLQPNQRAGATHDYVVPDAVVEKEKEMEDDYSMLTVNDLKLLLKSEGVPFPSSATKEQLLELVNEHIKGK